MKEFVATVLCGLGACSLLSSAGIAKTQPSKEYGYFRWIECADGYGGALAWNGYPLENSEQARRYPQGSLHNVHVHVLKPKAEVERDGKKAHDAAVRLCAGKIALFSRVSDKDRALLDGADMSAEVRESLNPTDTGHIIVFDEQDRIIGISDVVDMRQVSGMYAQFLRRSKGNQ